MSAVNDKKENALVPRPSSAVEKTASGPKRILSGIVADTLALAIKEPRVPSPAKFRIGKYEWCEPDYRQILIWAEETGLMPEEVTTRLFDQQSLCKDRFGQPMTKPYFDGPLFLDGRLLRVNWDLKLLRCNRIEWVNGLEIIGIRFIGASDAASLSDIGALPLARLKWLICHRVGLTHLALSRLPALKVLGCSENRLEKLQLHSSAQLTHLFCAKNMLAELEVSQISKLRVLHCADNAISELDLSSCQNLEKVNCSKNPIRVLDIRGLKHLRTLHRSPDTKVIMDPEQEHIVQDLEAQFQMGMSFYHGKDVHQNYAEAVRFFRSAAEGGHSSAQAYLGLCYENGIGIPQDYPEAGKWFRRAANQGNAGGQCALGYQYHHGHGVPQDHAEAAKWFLKAADQGNADAQYNLGQQYFYGHGVLQDYTEAAKWFLKAVEQGDASAPVGLGNQYRDGLGVARDVIEAYKWFKLAAEQGHKDAAKELASITSMLSPGEQQEGDRRYREFKASH